MPEQNPFDKAARFAVKQLDPPGMMAWMPPEAIPANGWRLAGWIDSQTPPFPREPERRCDTIAVYERIPGDGPPVAAVVEVQAQPQTGMLQRLAEYVMRVYEEVPYQRGPTVRYDVVGVLLQLTGKRQSEQWVMQPPGFGGAGLSFRVWPVPLSEKDARQTLADIAAGKLARCVLVWIPLMQGGGDPEVAVEWRRLAELEPDRRRRAEFAAIVLTFAELGECLAVWQKALEGWNMLESKVVNEWIAIGEARGEAKGTAALQSVLRRVLLRRFGESLPPEAEQQINAQADAEILQRWCELAVTAPDLTQWQASTQLP